MFLLPVLGDGVVNQCLLRFSVGVLLLLLLLLVVVRSGGDGCEIEENALPFACFFVVVCIVHESPLSLLVVLLRLVTNEG